MYNSGPKEWQDRITARSAGEIAGTTSCSMAAASAVGVFDSGIGGLSVLRHIRTQLPHENLLYFADTGFALYGDKPEDVIVARSLTIAAFLIQQGAKALVVACNTATAAAIKALRSSYPALPVIGVEPGLKPAAALTQSKTVGVLATNRTLASAKFNLLREQINAATNVRFVTQACIGLADQVEKGDLQSSATALLVHRYVAPLIAQGADTLVLGCTHYPFVQTLIEEAAIRSGKSPVTIIDTGEAVARQLLRLLEQDGIQNPASNTGTLKAFSTGSKTTLAAAFATLLNLHPAFIEGRVML
ncbi:glutamate racemase [Methylomonas sp. AM2-LC]|uniref:glutamate racemase n=1 Tax=Methylomonas sp. AM2-LC TaxID=3153301 RepID=UPI003263351D